MNAAGLRRSAARLVWAVALLWGAGCSSDATCQDFCHHFYGCNLTGYLGSSSEADCEFRCPEAADAGACQDYGAKLGCLNSLTCSQLDLSTPDLVIENLGRYHVCDIKGGCFLDGG
jgi:hypothetical protein